MLVRPHIAVVIEIHQATDQIGGGNVTGEYEHTECAAIGRLPYRAFAGTRVADCRLGQTALSRGDRDKLGIVTNLDLRMALRLGRDGRIAGEIVIANQHGDLAGVFGEEHRLFGRGETTADHQHLLAGEELAITGGAIGHAASRILLFAIESDLARIGTGGDKHAERAKVTARRMHGFDIAAHVKPGDFGAEEFRAEILRLLPYGGGQRPSAGGRDARVIDDLIGDGDLPAEIAFFHNQHAVAGAGEVQSRGKAGRTASNHDNVI